MKYFKLFFTAIFGMFLIASCGDEGITPDLQNQPDCIGFTKAEMATVGTLHNQYVTKVYQKVDFVNCNDCSEEVLQEFANLDVDFSVFNKTQEELINEARALYQDLEAIQFDLRNWQDHPFSQEAYAHLSSIMAEMDAMENYSDFVSEMINLQTIVDSDASLSCFDLELVTITIEVAKSSAYLWLPQSAGGLDFYSISQEGKIQPRWSWRNAEKADVSAAAGYFMGVGVGLIIPGTNAAIAGAIGFASGFASAMGGL